MEPDKTTDAIDEIIDDLHEHYPELDAVGLPVAGRILRLARYLEARREDQLDDYDLTPADFDVLATLRRKASQSAINVRELQHSLMLSSGGMTKRLDRLEVADLLERRRDPDDRRGVLIAITDAGRDLIDRVLPAVTNAESDLIAAAIPTAERRAQVAAELRHLLIAQEAD
ncbi:MAG: MarR family transcriptional regulator [Acidimicrobiales bacterium]|nr:MarR family transcriptional regulator [Acidimicrobiales bacterium]